MLLGDVTTVLDYRMDLFVKIYLTEFYFKFHLRSEG